MTIKDRILFYVAEKGIKKETFYSTVQMAASNFKGSAMKSDLGVDKVVKILDSYPELSNANNIIWLITGKGELKLVPEIEKEKDQHDDTDLDNNEQVGDVLASLFAQSNVHGNHLNFISTQFEKLFSKINEIENKTDQVLKNLYTKS